MNRLTLRTGLRAARLATALLAAVLLPGLARAEIAAPEDVLAEDAFLDLLPALDLPGEVVPIPGAVNETFRSCEAFWPEGYAQARTGPEARALRDVLSLVAARNVIATQNCGCGAKVADWGAVEAIAAALRQRHGVERLGWRETRRISEEARELVAIAEGLCGGAF